jgi:ferric-dicitrate binding protein FerR (iron transport regulator)
MPKGPDDETKFRTEEAEPGALSWKRHSAASDSPAPMAGPVPRAREPMKSRARRSGLGMIAVLLALAAIGAAIWWFFLR